MMITNPFFQVLALLLNLLVWALVNEVVWFEPSDISWPRVSKGKRRQEKAAIKATDT